MSLSPEAKARVTAIKATAEGLRDVNPNDPRIHDFVRNGKGSGDILWLVGQLEKAHENAAEDNSESGLISHQEIPGDSRQSEILSQVRTLVGANNDEEIIDKVAALVVPSERELPEGHGLAYGDSADEEDDYDEDFDDEDDGNEF